MSHPQDSAVAETPDIAIIGMVGRFPGAQTLDAFWKQLREGVEPRTEWSADELKQSGTLAALVDNPNYVRAAFNLDDVEWFDAGFFNMTPREAEITNPQHRVFLECAWEALESAGYDAATYAGAIGVYAGASANNYGYRLYSNREVLKSASPVQISLGNGNDHLAMRVSYKLNLRGPSMAVQTSCSTSLVAVHLACQSLLAGECDMALAGGVSISVPRRAGYLYQEGGVLSADGHCRAFDARAGGTVGGNGVGIVVLKRLRDALAEGDWIRAVIKGSAINNDGASRVGYAAPGVTGQVRVIAAALDVAGVDCRTVSYVEAHGTGTVLGDPIEIAALTQAYRSQGHQWNGTCAIGSVKTNIGHLDAAAGVAGLIKTVLALEHREIPPSLHFQTPNPKIDFAGSPFYVNARLGEWPDGPTPRRAGVSSFGIGGTNAHVIVEEAPPSCASGPGRPWQLLVLSARSAAALDQATLRLIEHLRQPDAPPLADVAYTLHVGRHAFKHRRMLVCRDAADALHVLEQPESSRVYDSADDHRQRPVTWLFSGQGTQYPYMAWELYRHESVFRRHVDRAALRLRAVLGDDLRHALYPEGRDLARAREQLTQTAWAQPALFAVEYALAQVWLEWGVRPQAMLGHSVGEFVAACLAGVIEWEDALDLVAVRGKLMQQQVPGAMLAVNLSEEAVRSTLGSNLWLAAVNGPESCVVSGGVAAIEQLERQLRARAVACQRLQTSHAFHSGLMDGAVESFIEHVSRLKLRAPNAPYISSVTGTWIEDEHATDPRYWGRQLREPVRFAAGVQVLCREPGRILLEVGPGHTLCHLARMAAGHGSAPLLVSSLPEEREKGADQAFLLTSLGRLWLAGAEVGGTGLYAGQRRQRVVLPSYPFERQRHWIDSSSSDDEPRNSAERKAALEDWFYVSSWKRTALPSVEATHEPQRCWWVFMDGCGVAADLVRRLEQQGQTVIRLTAGAELRQLEPRAYCLRPASRADYVRLVRQLQEQGATPHKIVHLWSVRPRREPTGANRFEQSQEAGFYSLLYLVQVLGEQNLTAPLDLVVVANHLQDVTGEERLDPERATLLGPCRVIPLEYPHVSCRSVDVEASAADASTGDLLWAELHAETSDTTIAYRGRYRWTQSFEPIRLGTASGARLRANGVYLITGGMGGVGLTLAEGLARQVQAKLVLTGRSASRTSRKLEHLEQLGAEVLVLSADVADVSQMEEVVRQTRARFGELNGVIHAAGVPGGRMLQLETAEDAARVLSPKVMGTLAIDHVLRDVPLDFLVLCSSLGAILPGFGQVDYCAANAFLDAYALHRNRVRPETFTVSVNWGRWGEVGMAVNHASPWPANRSTHEGADTDILPQEGIEAFQRVLGSSVPQIVVSPRDLRGRIERRNTRRPSIAPDAGARRAVGPTPLQRPGARSPCVPPATDEETIVAGIWRQLLGVESIGRTDDFFELGGNSLVATYLLARLREQFEIDIPLRSLFEAPTVRELGERVREALRVKRQDLDKMAHTLEHIEALSQEQVNALLQEHR
jgi:acyl transferase domain-containing protein/acyl carrier protein